MSHSFQHKGAEGKKDIKNTQYKNAFASLLFDFTLLQSIATHSTVKTYIDWVYSAL